jgi:hypothetical protein
MKRAPGQRSFDHLAAALFVALLLPVVPVRVDAQAPGPPRLVGPARLTLDPVCNARAGASLQSALRHEGSAPVRLVLTASEPVSKTPGKIAVAKAAITPLNEAGQPATDRTSLAPGDVLGVRVDLTGTLDTGEWEIEIRNAGTPVGAVTVVSPPAAFGVKLDTATPDAPELAFERGRPATIALRNDDAVGYQVTGQYSVRGIVQDADRAVWLSPGGGGELTLTPPDRWFAPVATTLFKDDVTEGRLTLRATSAGCPNDGATAARVVKARTTLAPWPPASRDVRANVLLLGTLLLGGLSSVALNFFLPAHARRRGLRGQLSLVARMIDDLPVQLDPRLRASVAVERRQLAERLRRLKFYDTQFPSEMTEAEQGLARLCTRLDLVAQMELVLNRYWRQRCVIVSDEIEELRRQLLDLLRRTDPGDGDIQAAQSLIKKLNELVTSTGAANPDLAARLAQHVAQVRDDFKPGAADSVGASPVWMGLRADLGEDFKEALESAENTDPAKIAPAGYVRLARAVFILDQVRAFVKLCKATGSTGTLTAEHKALRDRLMLDLRGGSWEQLQRAQRLIRQMREGIFYDQVDEEIRAGRVAIEATRMVVRQFEPTELRVAFLDRRVHGSAAREEYTCHWQFEYANITATGWSVSHLFPLATDADAQPAEHEIGPLRRLWRRLTGSSEEAPAPVLGTPYKVNVTFIRDDGHVAGTVRGEVRVRPPLDVKVRASLWMEVLRLSLALGIAAAGLIVGAREQILKLDVFPALITVFLLGFGSDRIKNLLGRSPSAPDEARPAGTP